MTVDTLAGEGEVTVAARRAARATALLAGLVLAGCESEPEATTGRVARDEPPAGHPLNVELAPARRCPGDPACAPGGDPTLYAGAAVRDITPDVTHTVVHAGTTAPHEFEPLSGDKCVKIADCDLASPLDCPAEDPARCTWIGGFGQGRSATDVADPVSVRCVALRRGETSLALCVVDDILWLYDEVRRTRELLAESHPELSLDLVVIASNHLHQNRDTVGFYGPDTGTSGLSREYNALIRERTVEAIAEAVAGLRPVHVQVGASRVDGHLAGTDPGGHRAAAFVSDTRDPVVIDDELRVIRFVAPADGETVATLVNWTAHPEYAGSRNRRITADYLGSLREAVEGGLDERGADGSSLYRADGVGGVALVFPGLIGGQVGPGHVKYVGFDGRPIEDDVERARNAGRLFAAYALEALGAGAQTLEAAPIGFRSREIYVGAENQRLLIGYNLGLFDTELERFDPTRPLGPGNLPVMRAEVAVIDVGPAELVTVPGEPHAESVLVTRDGKTALDAPYPFTPAPYRVLNDPATNPDCDRDGYSRCDDGPPDPSTFDGSLALDRFRDPAAEHRWILAMTHGYVGYLVPSYDWKLDPIHPYLEEATPGNHYEETVTLGPETAEQVWAPLRQLLRSPPVVRR